jgi:hypothetical protein
MSRPNKTVFFTEGGTMAVQQSADAEEAFEPIPSLATPEASLAWCRKHGIPFVYIPSAPDPADN